MHDQPRKLFSQTLFIGVGGFGGGFSPLTFLCRTGAAHFARIEAFHIKHASQPTRAVHFHATLSLSGWIRRGQFNMGSIRNGALLTESTLHIPNEQPDDKHYPTHNSARPDLFSRTFRARISFPNSVDPPCNCPSPSSVLCPLLYRTEHFSRGQEGAKEKGRKRGGQQRGEEGKKRRMKTAHPDPCLNAGLVSQVLALFYFLIRCSLFAYSWKLPAYSGAWELFCCQWSPFLTA